jgi:FkbM family methyltransferase
VTPPSTTVGVPDKSFPIIARLRAGILWRLSAARVRLRRSWYRDRPWIGRLVTLTGNRVTLDGCRFTLANPLITDAMRARILRGRYERSEREMLRTWMNPAAPVIECGGGLGIIATLIDRRLVHPDQHLVVEANPLLIPVLEEQKHLNGAAFTVLNRAIDYSGQQLVSLSVDDDFISGRVGPRGTHRFTVPAVTLRELVDGQRWQGATLVCDIEGAETDLVEHEIDVLVRCFDMLFIEAHPEFRSAQELETMFGRLEQAGFERIGNVRKVHAFRMQPRLTSTR